MHLYFIALLFVALTAEANQWPVAYDAEKGPDQISVSQESRPLDDYTKNIPLWNADINDPATKITSSEVKEIAQIKGLRILEVRLALADAYYTDALMILEEVIPERFLPVYVQDYERTTRRPSDTVIVKKTDQVVVIAAGMDYAGSGALHERYEITLAANQNPVVRLHRKHHP